MLLLLVCFLLLSNPGTSSLCLANSYAPSQLPLGGPAPVQMAPSASSYGKDERVLCFHHDILYEAKVLDLRHMDPDDNRSPYEYLVHYKGWKGTYVCSLGPPVC